MTTTQNPAPTVDVPCSGGVITVTTASIAPARWMWSESDQVIILDETASPLEVVEAMRDWALAQNLRAVPSERISA